MPEFKTEWERKTYEDAAHAMAKLVDLANANGSEKAVVEGMFVGFYRDHRTLQQSFMRNMFEMMKKWTDQEKSDMTDLRNECAFDWAKQAVKLDPTFPMDDDKPRFRGKMKIKRCWKCPFVGKKIGVHLSLCKHPISDLLEVRHGSDDPIPEECPLSKVPHNLT